MRFCSKEARCGNELMNAITDILDGLLTLLRSEGLQEWGAWSYLLLIILVIVEGPIVTLVGAVAASMGYMRLPLVVFSVLTGSAIADSIWYYLGYTHTEERILRYGRWLGLSRDHLDTLQREMRQHAPKLLLLAKFTSVLAIPTLVAAGLARVPFRRWFPIVFLGEIVWVTALAFIGFQATEVVRRVELGLHYLPLLGVGALLILLLVVSHRLKPSQLKESASSTGEPVERTVAESLPYTNDAAGCVCNGSAPRHAETRPAVLVERNGHLPQAQKPKVRREPIED